MEDELPDYDCDEEDEKWLEGYNKKNSEKSVELLDFERVIDTLEKSCSSRIDVSLHISVFLLPKLIIIIITFFLYIEF